MLLPGAGLRRPLLRQQSRATLDRRLVGGRSGAGRRCRSRSGSDALLQRLPTQVHRLIVYGSRVRGVADPDSDLDVAVVIEGQDRRAPDGWRPAPFGDPLWQTIVDTACDVSLAHDLYISPVVLTEDRLTEGAPFIEAISSEGIEVQR